MCSVYRTGEKAVAAGCCCAVFLPLSAAQWGAARAVVHGEAVDNGKGGKSPPCSRIARSAMRRACRAPPISPDTAETGGSALVRKTRRLTGWGWRRGWGKPRCDIETLLQKGLTTYSQGCAAPHILLLSTGCCRDDFWRDCANMKRRGTRRCPRLRRGQRHGRQKPPLQPHCAKRNAARVPRPADFAGHRRNRGICTGITPAAFF